MFPISDGELKARTRPYVNILLIIGCAIVFIYELTLGSTDRTIFFYEFGAIPAELAQGVDLAQTYRDLDNPIPTWATMFTSMFMHGGWFHFLGNMLFLWVFGDNIEDRLGHIKYLIFYLAVGLVALWLHIVVDPGSEVPTIGASGAISGVLGAYLVLFPLSRINTLVIIIFFITIVRIPAFILLGIWFVIQFFSGIGSLLPSGDIGGVAYWAHIGGFVSGVLVALLYRMGSFGSGNRSGGQISTYFNSSDEEPKYWRGRRL